jgi:hypothetical protein
MKASIVNPAACGIVDVLEQEGFKIKWWSGNSLTMTALDDSLLQNRYIWSAKMATPVDLLFCGYLDTFKDDDADKIILGNSMAVTMACGFYKKIRCRNKTIKIIKEACNPSELHPMGNYKEFTVNLLQWGGNRDSERTAWVFSSLPLDNFKFPKIDDRPAILNAGALLMQMNKPNVNVVQKSYDNIRPGARRKTIVQVDGSAIFPDFYGSNLLSYKYMHPYYVRKITEKEMLHVLGHKNPQTLFGDRISCKNQIGYEVDIEPARRLILSCKEFLKRIIR